MSWDCFGCFGGCGSVWRRLTGVLGTFDGCWGRLLGVLRAFEGVWDVFWGVGDVLGALGGVGGFWEPLTPHCTPNIPLRPFTPPNTQLHTKMLTNTSLHPITPQTPHYTPKHQFTPSKQPIILQKKTLYPKALPKHHLTPPLTLGLLYTLTTPNPGQGSTLAKRICFRLFDCQEDRSWIGDVWGKIDVIDGEKRLFSRWARVGEFTVPKKTKEGQGESCPKHYCVEVIGERWS